ncbi:sulfur carrier protein ThiS [Methylophaga nitratireducenticrescens]|uniref:Thiamine biosynthesis protein ThiS n=1 Tax=Methylophaga nitratireducenticrescens TaxID=754476 RepID=I1XKJ9_METNJ|nr:sulfur carrier protein ThiS [Methylophaga nitratireducenticrescens]AFI84918.1 thiamine biosynthesis protein ThiS [Methylophaga nitratireducenticrescens]AUZ84931.1 thiamine biosynthesis protein ThiS [Methylophaga nitratireducenticrescens]
MASEQLQIQFNGESVAIDNNQTIAAFLQQQKMANSRFVVLLNDEIVPKSYWAERKINPGDQVNIISPISGG